MKSKIFRYIGMYLVIAPFMASILCSDAVASKPYGVRVAILKDSTAFALSIRGKYKITDSATDRQLANGRRLRKSEVTAAPNGIRIGDQVHFVDRLRISAKKDISIYINGKGLRYRGQIDILRDKHNRFLVINTLKLEDYVKGVLYHEVPHYWPLTAIKTQAVATRTYVMYQISQKAGHNYDVTSDIYSQVFGGRSAERYRSNIAANRTRGQILIYDGKIFPAYFHSTCGGKTENVTELWNHDLSPLAGVRCGFCTRAPYFRWKKNFRSKTVQEQLNTNGFKLGLIKTIEIATRTKSGRVKTLKINTREGKSAIISAVRFREIIGLNAIKSNHFDIEMKGYYFDVTGRGWGHGVGMCQWGVYQMSKKRYKYTSILEHYYPGTAITNIKEL